MSRWATIGEVADVTKLAGFEFTKYIQYHPDGEIIAVRAVNLRDGVLNLEDVKRISRDTSNALERSKLRCGDILMSYTGTIGEVALVDENDKYHLAPNVCRLRAKDEIESGYLYYYLRSAGFRNLLSTFLVGSTQPTIPMKNIRRIGIPLPTRADQKKLVQLLRPFDNKIDLNRRMNETLEAMARAIFKDWFVEFGPTRAKMEARAPYFAPEIWALFPDRLDDEGKPEGWQSGSIADLAKISGGKQLDATEITSVDAVPVFGGAGPMGFTANYNVDGWVITFGRVGAYCGQFFWHIGKAWINNNASLVLPHRKDDALWLFLYMSSIDLEPIKRGAAQPFISNGDMTALPVILAEAKIRDSFTQLATPLFFRQKLNDEESHTLATARDLLLPKLMSGEIRVRDAEKIVEASV